MWKQYLIAGVLFIAGLVGTVLGITNLGEAEKAINQVASAPVVVLDLQEDHTAKDAHRTLEQMGPEGRAIYRKALTTWDVLLPISMCLMYLNLMFLLTWCAPKAVRAVMAVPIITMILDFMENNQELGMIDGFPAFQVNGTITYLKWGGIKANALISAVLFLSMILFLIMQWLRQRNIRRQMA